MNALSKSILCLAVALCASAAQADPQRAKALDDSRAAIPAGTFESVLPPAAGVKKVKIAAFRIDRTPVTNEQFAGFVSRHPQWQRDRIARVFADGQYLSHWKTPLAVDASQRDRPVVHVSWFAASAYCESLGARLPRWYEWEYVAAAGTAIPDARNDEAWRQNILNWYSTSGRRPLPAVGKTAANFYGVRDLHGVIWEWVDDLSSMLVSGDNRQQSDPDALRYCGPGALTMEQKENYAILMRIAMLSSMQASYTSGTMGFRCATDASSR
jgi:formylglycine-generating enzyme